MDKKLQDVVFVGQGINLSSDYIFLTNNTLIYEQRANIREFKAKEGEIFQKIYFVNNEVFVSAVLDTWYFF